VSVGPHARTREYCRQFGWVGRAVAQFEVRRAALLPTQNKCSTAESRCIGEHTKNVLFLVKSFVFDHTKHEIGPLDIRKRPGERLPPRQEYRHRAMDVYFYSGSDERRHMSGTSLDV
jgi:hypothetical protein